MSEDILGRIKILVEKKETAKSTLARATAQLESVQEQKEALESKFKERFGSNIEAAEKVISDLTASIEKELSESEEKLSQINL